MHKSPSLEESRRIRAFLDENEYSNPGVLKMLEEEGLPLQKPRAYSGALAPLPEGGSSLRALTRWFFLGLSLDATAARKVVPAWFIDVCLDSGLLTENGARLKSGASIMPLKDDETLLASDPLHKKDAAFEKDWVLTIGVAAESLMDFTIRSSVRNTLDLCGGSGIQALALASHSESVVTTDLNPRATAYATFNAHLNGKENIECIAGDLFDPVKGRKFDLIVCNPPFIVSPTGHVVSVENPMEIDLFCRKIVREVPDYLEDGGYFQMLLEWVDIEGAKWTDRLAEWFQGVETDIWVVKSASFSPQHYAQLRISEAPERYQDGISKEYMRWMDYYRQKRVQKIHTGFIMMRRHSGKRFVRMESVQERRGEPIGEELLNTFVRQDFLMAHESDESFLEAKLNLSPNLRMKEEFRRSPQGWRHHSIEIRFTKGFQRKLVVNRETAGFLGQFNGEKSTREVVEEIVAGAPKDAVPEQVRAEVLKLLRQWFLHGYLIPAEG